MCADVCVLSVSVHASSRLPPNARAAPRYARAQGELRRAVDAYAVSGTGAALQRVLDVYGDMVVVWQHTYLRRPDFAAVSDSVPP